MEEFEWGCYSLVLKLETDSVNMKGVMRSFKKGKSRRNTTTVGKFQESHHFYSKD